MKPEVFQHLGVIYQIEKNRGLELIDPTGYRNVMESVIHDMLIQGLIQVEGTRYLLGPLGVQLRNKMLQALDQIRAFEVFANVKTSRDLTTDESQDGVQVFDDIFDPRFAPGTDGEDLRLCMYELFGRESDAAVGVNTHLIVFLQKLLDEEFLSPGNFWPNLKLGILNAEIDNIVQNSVTLDQLDPNNEGIASIIYTAGMIEQRKRLGQVCSHCNTPLAIFEMMAEEEGRTLDSCPSCQKSYIPSQVDGVITTEEVVTYETIVPAGVYVDYWYEPQIYYYDPFDPFLDTLAFAILLDAIW
jgi:hypothetical protein